MMPKQSQLVDEKIDAVGIHIPDQDLKHGLLHYEAELNVVNREHDLFIYSVSHDLRAPLRHVIGFTRLLDEEFRDSLPAGAQLYVDRIQQSARRMDGMFDELVKLSRLRSQPVQAEMTELDAIVREVSTQFQPWSGERMVDWKIGRLPCVQCDPHLIRQVFEQLVSNALKFSRCRAPAVIEIDQTERNGQAVIFVRDNGVGFSLKYADKLFGVFQRLHRAEDFEGTGVGLAMVRSMIQKHGGRIWAEAEPGHGATFYFTLGSGQASAEGDAVTGEPA